MMFGTFFGNSKMKSTIRYPSWKIRGTPTPNEKLMVCDKCGLASWITNSPMSNVVYHTCSDNKQHRSREATAAEYKMGKAAIKEVI